MGVPRCAEPLSQVEEGEEIEVDAADSGACAVCTLCHDGNLWVANAGDCRAVLGSVSDSRVTAASLSTDHKVDEPREQARIEAAGAYVRPGSTEGEEFCVARVYEAKGKTWLGPGLCISRALGDVNAARAGVVATPEVMVHEIERDDTYLILASDGVWEFIDDEEAVQLVHAQCEAGHNADEAARWLIANAALCWQREEGNYRDDITVIVVYLKEMLANLPNLDSQSFIGSSPQGSRSSVGSGQSPPRGASDAA